jgi:RNA polymerase sigma-70 factor (ECF subfamily)
MRAYQDMVYTTAARLVGEDGLAEDIAQEVFVRAHANFTHLRGSVAPGGWLKTVATHLALNHLTRYRRRWRFFSELEATDAGSDVDPAPYEVPVPDSLLQDLDAEQRRAVIDRALLHLPAAQRAALVLYHFEEFSYEDIASHLHVSLSKVKTDIRRGRAALVSLLQDAGVARDTLRE